MASTLAPFSFIAKRKKSCNSGSPVALVDCSLLVKEIAQVCCAPGYTQVCMQGVFTRSTTTARAASHCKLSGRASAFRSLPGVCWPAITWTTGYRTEGIRSETISISEQHGITAPANEVTGTAQVPWPRYLGPTRSGISSPERPPGKPRDYCRNTNVLPVRQPGYVDDSFTCMT